MRNTRRPEIHKRMILLAMLPVLPPGIHRFYMVPLGLTDFPIAAMYADAGCDGTRHPRTGVAQLRAHQRLHDDWESRGSCCSSHCTIRLRIHNGLRISCTR